ncbi:MAG: hypothetical protein P8Z37_00785 [Acidobacteriota bacterium]
MEDETTFENRNNDLEIQFDKATVSRRTFGAAMGAAVAMIFPRATQASSVVEGNAAPAKGTATNVIRTFHPPGPAKDLETAIVYRREDEFASHPYVSGFWETTSASPALKILRTLLDLLRSILRWLHTKTSTTSTRHCLWK